MIYLGVWSQHSPSRKEAELKEKLQQYAGGEPLCINKNNFVLAYGKQHPHNDMDQVWETNSSILIGRIFDNENYVPVSSQTFENFSEKTEENLTHKIWGQYVYWRMSDSNKLDIMVNPSGKISCFYYVLPNGDLIFSSHVQLIQDYLQLNLEHNWSYLCSYLFYGNSSSIQTPFKGVEEIPPGCVLKATPHSRKIMPFRNHFATYKAIKSFKKDAVETLQAVLKSMIEPYENVCVSLSGGLDSSSLVYCLKDIIQPHQKLSALNYFHEKVQSSNELFYARKVCEDVGIPLIEAETSNILPFDPYNESLGININKPYPGLMSLKSINAIPDYLPSDGSCIFLSGHGSDHIFMRPPTKKSLADYWLTHGVAGLSGKIKEITHFYRDSLTPILIQNFLSIIRYGVGHKPNKRGKNPQDKPPRWLKPKIHRYRTNQFVHPVYNYVPSWLLPGKYSQIDALYEGLASVHVNANDLHPEHFPFFCEPIVNFAFSIPTYDLFQDGYDRWPLRQAVYSHFRADVAWRRDKGETTGILQLGVKKNIDYVLDLCLDGEMVQQGLVDKEKLRKTILLISRGDHHDMWPFIHLASIELFLRMWSQKS